MQASPVKTPASFKYRIVASLALLSLLAACGYKGPLYMPPPEPPQDSLTKPPRPPAPAPAPDESTTAKATPSAIE